MIAQVSFVVDLVCAWKDEYSLIFFALAYQQGALNQSFGGQGLARSEFAVTAIKVYVFPRLAGETRMARGLCTCDFMCARDPLPIPLFPVSMPRYSVSPLFFTPLVCMASIVLFV